MVTIEKDKKEAIFNATLKLITENGFDATPMSAIAKEADVAAGTIYTYFENKEELINKLYLKLKEKLTNAVTEGYKPGLSTRVTMELFWNNYVQFFLKNPMDFRFFEQFTSSPYINKYTKEEGLRIFHPVLELFEKAKAEKAIKDLPNDIILAHFFAPVKSLIALHVNNNFNLNDSNLNSVFQASWDSLKS
ncbi:MAG: TetR/AcrR family transcriptional regulator [Ignavibacteriae bacterium]|nr:TetR/AcrR family transcriptional regulator [Ignavibacteriota bacterium]